MAGIDAAEVVVDGPMVVMVVDPRSPTPPYEQIRAQIITQVRSGELAHGARLPTVRRLAADLALAPNTVARAYRELEAAGAVVTRGRHGTFVADSGDAAAREATAAARTFAVTAHRLGVPPAEALALVEAALTGGATAEPDLAGDSRASTSDTREVGAAGSPHHGAARPGTPQGSVGFATA